MKNRKEDVWNEDLHDGIVNLSEVEGSILLFIQEYVRNPVLDVVFQRITHLGDVGIFWIILTVILLCFKRTRKAGVSSACALMGSLLVNNLILKNLFQRTRPYEVVEGLVCLIAPATDASFPSGHTGASFASAVAIFLQLRKLDVPASAGSSPEKHPHAAGKQSRTGFRIVRVLLLILAALIAFSRLYVGIHYPTDVLGGLVTGIALGFLGDALGEKLCGREKNKRK